MSKEVTKVNIEVNGKTVEVPSVVKSKGAFGEIKTYNNVKSYVVPDFAININEEGKLERVNCYIREREIFEAFKSNGYRLRFATMVGEFVHPSRRNSVYDEEVTNIGIRTLLPFVQFCGTFELCVKGQEYEDKDGEVKDYSKDWYKRTALDFAWGEHFEAFKNGDVKHFLNLDDAEDFEVTEL